MTVRLEKALWPLMLTVAFGGAVLAALIYGAFHESAARRELATRNCTEIQELKATFVQFIADVTYYNAKTKTVHVPPGRPNPTPEQAERTVAFNQLTEKRFAPRPCL